jgi:hypothetical protein
MIFGMWLYNDETRFMIIHGTPTYQISLIYRKRQKGYDSDTITLKKYQLFDLNVHIPNKKDISKIIQENRQKGS